MSQTASLKLERLEKRWNQETAVQCCPLEGTIQYFRKERNH
jgi:hypothetical protein